METLLIVFGVNKDYLCIVHAQQRRVFGYHTRARTRARHFLRFELKFAVRARHRHISVHRYHLVRSSFHHKSAKSFLEQGQHGGLRSFLLRFSHFYRGKTPVLGFQQLFCCFSVTQMRVRKLWHGGVGAGWEGGGHSSALPNVRSTNTCCCTLAVGNASCCDHVLERTSSSADPDWGMGMGS